ncbi:MAG TPA: CHASE2 domain-containing protein [Casimicrobiaceae bacterium]|nr:CHASE2 domain-containing protein [Casimicrobiaceae bacterium]
MRLVGAAILVAFAVALALDLPRALPLQSAWFDALQRLSPRMPDATPVTIVAIDDRSLSQLGRWPWPRRLLARLMHTINAYGPAAIGVDIVMPEPDPLSPDRALAYADVNAALREQVTALPSNDIELANAFRVAPTVVVMAGAPDATEQPLRVVPIVIRDADADTDAAARARNGLMHYPAALSSLAMLNDAARGWGLISVPDLQGMIRRLPLVADVNGTLTPGLALEMWRVALHASVLRLLTADGSVRAVAVGTQAFATEADGSVRAYFSPHEPDRFVSAVDVLAGSVGVERLGRTFVLIGVTALALGDYAWTPVAKMPGVEVHAQLLENMSENAFLVRPRGAPFVEAAALLLLGALLIGLTPRWSVRYTAIFAIACVALLLASAYALFRMDRLLFDAVTPAVAFWLLFGMLVALELADATRNRKALQRVLQHEREESARVAGELQAARRIQLDTLPRAEKLRDPRIELAASMEPAQEVGGDLYDFYLLDENRLFFMLGDVSGKGLSASIFMAVSKALCKSTMLRSTGADLGALLSQANLEVERDNPGALFVTVFAGVLDLRSGQLDYCNAGQENPWRVRAGGGEVTRLTEGGGPPLCVVDDFAYRAARTQLQPGDLLCIVSDGVTEAHDRSGALYGAARVDAVLAHVDSAPGAVAAIGNDVKAFADGAEPADDMTVLGVRWRGCADPGPK